MDAAAHYAATRERITDLVTGLSPDELNVIAPATPLWRVRDIVGHLSGGCADILNGNVEGVATDAWTAAQVEPRRKLPFDEVVGEWSTVGPKVEELIPMFPAMSRAMFIVDCVTHEHDIRGAVGRPGERDSEALDFALQKVIAGLPARLDGAGAPALRMVAGNQEWVVGTGEPAATVTADAFEFLRAMIGRRSRDQIAAYTWDGDSGPYLGCLSAFPIPAAGLVE